MAVSPLGPAPITATLRVGFLRKDGILGWRNWFVRKSPFAWGSNSQNDFLPLKSLRRTVTTGKHNLRPSLCIAAMIYVIHSSSVKLTFHGKFIGKKRQFFVFLTFEHIQIVKKMKRFFKNIQICSHPILAR